MSGLSLYGISQTIADLIDLREDPLVTEAEREVIDGQIREWVEAEVRKVDNVRAYLKHCHVMQHAALVEAEEQKKRAEVWENRMERLKTICKMAMEAFGMKKLEGNTGVLRIQANGGKQKLTIKREDLIPEEYITAKIKMPHVDWLRLLALLNSSPSGKYFLQNAHIASSGETDEAKVRAALESKCRKCGGFGRISNEDGDSDLCSECCGAGHVLVPGAELEPRGDHLRVE